MDPVSYAVVTLVSLLMLLSHSFKVMVSLEDNETYSTFWNLVAVMFYFCALILIQYMRLEN
jgi:hypothetical protein